MSQSPEVIMLREQTAVLHSEHLYNAMDHHYEIVRLLVYFILCSPVLFYIAH